MGPLHAGLCELLEEHPRLLVEALVRLEYLPDRVWRIELRATEALLPDRDRSFKEVRADLVLLLRPPADASGEEPGDDACIAILLETQLVIDWEKLPRWRSFGLAYRPDLCPHMFLVSLTLSAKTELWLRRDIQTWIDDLRMTVLSPRNVATIAWDPAESPAHALLCAVFEADGERAEERLMTAIEGLHTFPAKRRMVYEEMLLSTHGEDRVMTAIRNSRSPEVQAILDKWPGYEPNEIELKSYLYVRGERRGREEGREEGIEEGRAEGLATGILAVLDQRQVPTDPAARERILACRNVDQLDHWMRRALRVESAEQLFA
jgi:hypothetical protein